MDVYVFAGAVNAKREESGIYEMSKAEFDVIAADLIANGGNVKDMEELLDALDEGAMGDRWIRLSDVVANWVDSKPPKLVVEESIF